MQHLQHFQNNFTTNLMWYAITNSNSNLSLILILIFYPPLTIFCIRFIVKILGKLLGTPEIL